MKTLGKFLLNIGRGVGELLLVGLFLGGAAFALYGAGWLVGLAATGVMAEQPQGTEDNALLGILIISVVALLCVFAAGVVGLCGWVRKCWQNAKDSQV
jgi:hypothetical protein